MPPGKTGYVKTGKVSSSSTAWDDPVRVAWRNRPLSRADLFSDRDYCLWAWKDSHFRLQAVAKEMLRHVKAADPKGYQREKAIRTVAKVLGEAHAASAVQLPRELRTWKKLKYLIDRRENFLFKRRR
jgi:hypothetical protein